MRLGRQKDSSLEGDQLVGVGRRITEARLEAGMTKMELAEKLGVPLGLFERYEAGGEDPSPHLGRLAQVTGKPVTWFRGEAPGAVTGDDTSAEAEAEPEVIEPEEEPVLLPESESEPAASNGGSSEPDETTVEPLVLGESDPEPEAEPEAPMPAASEPEPEPEVSSMPAAASGASMADDGDDDLDRLLSSLGRQREQMAARRKELDDREQALADREADLERRDQELSDRALSLDDRETDLTQREGALGEQANAAATAQLDADWQEKLQSFEDTNRQYAQAAAALADWAVELRNASGGEESSSGAAEPESEPLKSSSSADDDFPDDF